MFKKLGQECHMQLKSRFLPISLILWESWTEVIHIIIAYVAEKAAFYSCLHIMVHKLC